MSAPLRCARHLKAPFSRAVCRAAAWAVYITSVMNSSCCSRVNATPEPTSLWAPRFSGRTDRGVSFLASGKVALCGPGVYPPRDIYIYFFEEIGFTDIFFD